MTQLLVTQDKEPRTIEVQPSKCRSCGAIVLWGKTRLEKRCPYNEDGTSHFTTCPAARQWTKR